MSPIGRRDFLKRSASLAGALRSAEASSSRSAAEARSSVSAGGVKSSYDPDDFFNFAQSIPPA